MTNVRRTVSRFIGGTQCVLGVVASVFAFIIYASPSTREAIAITSEGEVYLYMFLSLIFGVFSILSGLLLIRGEK
ncbi:MAG: hypothetical protein K6T73_06405 [Candidatus Bathyarchaeota archaeon]|jgi:Na+/citrate or Na+/malate symporter|nr:hypothetical protein [Candidatus Bathyarchaeota archaeon]